MMHDMNYRPSKENRELASKLVNLLETDGPKGFFERMDVMFLAVVMACGLAGYHQILERLLNRLNAKPLTYISTDSEMRASKPER
jgi:hypothetical protein